MPLDDEVRDRLHSEIVGRGRTGPAPASVLAELRPAMVHARRVRRVTQIAAGGFLAIGAIAVAQVGTRPGDDSLQVVPTDEPAVFVDPDPSPTTTARPDDGSAGRIDDRHEDAPDRELDERPSASDSGDEAIPPPTADDHTDQPVADAAATDAPPTPTTGPHDADAREPETEGDADDASAEDDPDEAPGESSTTSTPTPPPASTVTSTTEVPSPVGTHFDSACGSVLAIVGDGQPRIVEISPAPGYRAKVEDPDHETIVVHFEGGGEDCELIIG